MRYWQRLTERRKINNYAAYNVPSPPSNFHQNEDSADRVPSHFAATANLLLKEHRISGIVICLLNDENSDPLSLLQDRMPCVSMCVCACPCSESQQIYSPT